MRDHLEYRHVDVFAETPFAGNGLIVLFADPASSAAGPLIALTAELRQFELIMVDHRMPDGPVAARIFTADEELPFAGHPLLGAAAALHERWAPQDAERSWTILVAGREIEVRTTRSARYYHAEMNQGVPELRPPIADADADSLAAALGIDDRDRHTLPMQVVSTGLPYLIVPVARGLDRARIAVPDFADRLAGLGAKFAYVFDPTAREGRSWDNAGSVEDVATGSAAGPAAAYLAAHGWTAPGEAVRIHQGRFVGRPSVIEVATDERGALWVGGPVAPVGRGVIDSLPG